MRDKDSQLIFENYEKKVLINEAVPVLLIAGLLAPIAAYLSSKIGLTDAFTDFIKRETKGLVDIEEWSKTIPYSLVSAIDITGISSWPVVDDAIKAYEKNPTSENKYKLWVSVFYAVPVLGKFGAFVKACEGSKVAVKALPLVWRFGIRLCEKFLLPILNSNAVKTAILKMVSKSGSKMIANILTNVLGILGVRWITKGLMASYLSGDDTESETELEVSDEKDQEKNTLPTIKPKNKKNEDMLLIPEIDDDLVPQL